MSTNYKVISNDGEFQQEMNNAGSKLVVVDFTSARCPPCQQIAPAFQSLSTRYLNAIFLKVDIQECPGTASAHGIRATPTFVFFKNKTKIDTQQGANIAPLEARVAQYYGSEDEEGMEDCGVPGQMDLLTFVNKSGCECLNENDSHPFTNALFSGDYLESDADEQLILFIGFNQSVKIHSLKFQAPLINGPKTIKLFINQPYTLDFDSAETGVPVQEVELTKDDLKGELVPLKYVRFQNVMNVTLFMQNNQNEEETTRIDSIQLIGSPVQTTKMSDFKRVAGKKGESHR